MKSMSIPKWDGKSKSCPRYVAKTRALAEYYGCGEALDELEMMKCPSVTQFKILSSQTTCTPDQDFKVELYKQKKQCYIIGTMTLI